MSSDKINPDQFRMFMRPHEIKELVPNSVDAFGEGSKKKRMSRLWEHKEREITEDALSGAGASYGDLKESIKKVGVMRPVTLYTGMETPTGREPVAMGQGHHRVAAAEMAERETGKDYYIPVIYSNDIHETEDDSYSYEREADDWSADPHWGNYY